MDVFFIRSVRDDFFAAFQLLTVSVMGRARSAKGHFSKYDSVHNATHARAEKTKNKFRMLRSSQQVALLSPLLRSPLQPVILRLNFLACDVELST